MDGNIPATKYSAVVTCTSRIHSTHKTRNPDISMTSMMQCSVNSLVKSRKFCRHENASKILRIASFEWPLMRPFRWWCSLGTVRDTVAMHTNEIERKREEEEADVYLCQQKASECLPSWHLPDIMSRLMVDAWFSALIFFTCTKLTCLFVLILLTVKHSVIGSIFSMVI